MLRARCVGKWVCSAEECTRQGLCLASFSMLGCLARACRKVMAGIVACMF